MPKVGVAVLKEPGPVRQRVKDRVGAKHRPDRLVARTQALGDAQNIRRDPVCIAGKELAGPSHPAHHFVENEQHAITVADLADAPEIPLDRWNRPKRCPDNRLRHKGHDRFRPETLDRVFQILRRPLAISLDGFIVPLLGIGIAGCDVLHVDQDWPEGRPPPFVAPGSQRAQRIAMIALTPGDDMTPFRGACLDKVLPRQLERCFDRLGPAGDKVDPIKPPRRLGDQQICQFLGRGAGEKPRMCKSQIGHLFLDRLNDLGITVPQTRDRRPARPVQIALAGFVDQIDARRRKRHGRGATGCFAGKRGSFYETDRGWTHGHFTPELQALSNATENNVCYSKGNLTESSWTRPKDPASLPRSSTRSRTCPPASGRRPSILSTTRTISGSIPFAVTAEKAKVSTYTLVKLSKALGFSGFEALRAPFRNALLAAPGAVGHPGFSGTDPDGGPLANAFANAANNAVAIVTRTLEQQDRAQLEEIVELMLNARCVFLTAVRSTYAIAYYLHYVGRMALPALQLIPRHRNSAIDDLTDAREGDVLVAITVTPYSRETIAACEFARKKGVKLVMVSDSEVVSPHLDPDHTLAASVMSTHHFGSMAGMMVLVELLIALLMERGGTAARERIRSYEQVRADTNAYWGKQEKH